MDTPSQQADSLNRTIRSWISGINWISVAILLAVLIAVSVPVYSYRILNPVNSDFGNHNQYALRILRGEDVPDHILAHPVYAYLIGILIWLTRSGLDADHASIVIMTISQALTGLFIYLWLGRRAEKWSESLRVALAIGLTLAAPLMLLVPLDEHYYFGYIGLANYHNPTIVLLRPLGVLTLIISAALFESTVRKNWLLTGAAFVITGLATLTKPNLAIIWLPALGLEWIWQVQLPRRRLFWPIAVGFILPAVIILGWQFLATYASADGGSGGIVWAPFVVEAGSSGYLVVKFLLSIWLALISVAIYRRKIFNGSALRLTWMAFAFGAAAVYLLAEGGNRLDDGNFRWGAQIGLLLLFIAIIRFVWRQPVLGKLETVVLLTGFSPHVIAGVVYFVHCLISKSYG